jgi:predicted nucleic acid-binding protein
MNFLVDTNVVSEWVKPRPDPGVVAWMAGADEDRVFLSVVTLAELRYGIERLAAGRRRRQLEDWLQLDLPTRFERRVLAIDGVIADVCGRLTARAEAAGRPIETMDALLAATAHVYGLTLVTRNTSDFKPLLRSVVNPWGTT